uniref:Uncharacterized protein n=1 Tax=Avena sativa TaxID=4498 RepID=A0ACD5ZA73_AVESA
MALRNLAAKMRIPASAAAAARLPSVPRVSAASGSRAPFSSFSPEAAARKSATEWYLHQRERYEEGTRRLARYRLEVLWAERVTKLLTWTYRLSLPFAIGATGVRATGFQPTPV